MESRNQTRKRRRDFEGAQHSWTYNEVQHVIKTVRATGDVKAVARELGATLAQVRGVLHRFDPDLDIKAVKAGLDDEKVEAACKGVDKVSIKEVRRLTGLSHERVRAALVRLGLWDAEGWECGIPVGRRYGLWEIVEAGTYSIYRGQIRKKLPNRGRHTGRTNSSGSRVKARCLGCGGIQFPLKRNLLNGMSKRCKNCARLRNRIAAGDWEDKGSILEGHLKAKPVISSKGRRFASQKQAARALGINPKTFRYYLVNQTFVNGETWSYDDEENC